MPAPSKTNLRVLSQFWYPLIFEKQLPTSTPVAVELLGTTLVVYRARNTIVVAQDHCPHRGASLSLGRVAGGSLTCAYHGLQFGPSGKCENLRQRCAMPFRDDLYLTTFPCSNKYGLIWTCLNPQAEHDIPQFHEYDDSSYCSLSLPPLEWEASPIRQVEGVFDLTHFAYVHQASGCSMLGSTEEMPPYVITRKRDVILVDFRSGSKERCGFWERVYKITLPFTVQMSAQRTPNGIWTLFNTVRPVSEEKSVIFVIQAFNFNKRANRASMRAFEEMVYKEDQRIVESQTPVMPHLTFRDECVLPEDRIAVAYRAALKRMGLTNDGWAGER